MMNQAAEMFGMGLAVLLLALPLGLVAAIAGVRSWIGFWTVALILIVVATLLFSNPVHKSRDDFIFTAAMATAGLLFDGLVIRAGLRAVLRWWERRAGRSVPQA